MICNSELNGHATWFLGTVLICIFSIINPVEDAIAQNNVTLIAGGDVEWSRITYQPDIYYDNPEIGDGEWRKVPYLNTPQTRDYLSEKYTRILESPDSHHKRALHYDLEGLSDEEILRYPFNKIAPVLRQADIAFINLETPLSNSARWKGAFRTPEEFGNALKWAGIDVANIANNHALDAENEGLMDTIESLNKNEIGNVGGGKNLESATKPYIVEKNGISFAFLGYAQFENSGTSSFAQPEPPKDSLRSNYYKPMRSGIAPMDPFLIKRNIKEIRDQVDYVIVSFHWAIENSQETHPGARKFAKEIVDAGADMIFGHHPHVPRGVEVYNGKPIFYCFGNFIFGHNHDYWKDNYLARLTMNSERIEKIEVLPIAGSGHDLSQPYLLNGDRGQKLLKEVQELTRKLDTEMEIQGNIGLIKSN